MSRLRENLIIEPMASALQITKDQSGNTLKLSGRLQISVANELRGALLEFTGSSPTPRVDLSGVTECDTAGLQLLCSAGRTAESGSKPLELVGISPAVCSAAEALGLPLTRTLPPQRGSADGV